MGALDVAVGHPIMASMAAHLETDHLKARLHELLASRDFPKTICPSEAPRSLSTSQLEQLGASGWRDLMDETRAIVWSMRDRGEVEILQRGHILSDDARIEDVKGPIRVRRKGPTGD